MLAVRPVEPRLREPAPLKATFVWMVILVLAVMAGLGLLRVPFALRFWVRMRRLGYVYVGLIVFLAALSVVIGHRL